MKKIIGEPQAFQILRSYGEEFFKKNSWPTKKDINWRYNNLEVFKNSSFTEISEAKVSSNFTLESIKSQIEASPNWPRLVFINGQYNIELSQPSQSKKYRILNLKDAIEKGLYPTKDLSRPSDAFEALNLSNIREGLFIEVDKGDVKSLDDSSENTQNIEPLELYFYNTPFEIPMAHFPRVIVNLKTGAKTAIIENYHSSEQLQDKQNVVPQWSNVQVEVNQEPNSKLTWARIQNQNFDVWHTSHSNYYLAENSQLHFLTLSIGAQLYKHKLNVSINGENCEVVTHGISLGRRSQQKDHQTLIEFAKGHSSVEQIFKAILDDSSQSVVNGKIVIHKNSQKANASQLTKTLLLSEKAEANNIPQLEIFADDVKASHGATIGQLNAEELFYFRSRGISEGKAQAMLQKGFVLDLVERFPHELIKQHLKNHLHWNISDSATEKVRFL